MGNAAKDIFDKLNEYDIRYLTEHLALAGCADNLH